MGQGCVQSAVSGPEKIAQAPLRRLSSGTAPTKKNSRFHLVKIPIFQHLVHAYISQIFVPIRIPNSWIVFLSRFLVSNASKSSSSCRELRVNPSPDVPETLLICGEMEQRLNSSDHASNNVVIGRAPSGVKESIVFLASTGSTVALRRQGRGVRPEWVD